MQLHNEVWNKIPGTTDSWVFPLIRKPSITGSNTFIIRSGRNLLVIDPGAISDQMDRTLQILSGEIEDPDRPILIIAGHIHIDHMYLGLCDRRLRALGRILLVAEAGGAEHLKAGDQYWTGADVVEVPVPKTTIDLPLSFSGYTSAGEMSRISPPGVSPLDFETLYFSFDGSGYPGLSLHSDCPDTIEFWHTPGHSDDSMTIRIGSLFHIGDIPFAINPGIAGRPGYDRDSLIRSICGIRYLFEQDGGMICCPGHGRALNRQATIQMLEKLENDTRAMPPVALFDSSRLNLSLWHGLDLVQEAHRLFPVIAGRLLYLSHQLEELEMDEHASKIRTIFDHEKVDQLLDEFISFYQDFKDGKRVRHEVVSKALRMFDQIESAFPSGSLNGLVDLSIIRRASRIFSDFLGTIHGIVPKGSPEVLLLFPLLQECISQGSTSSASVSDIMKFVDDEEAFRSSLLHRLAQFSHLSQMECSIANLTPSSDIRILADRERFLDFFAGVAEYFESIGAESGCITPVLEDRTVELIFTPNGSAIRYERRIPGATLREAVYSGGKIISVLEPGKEDIRVSFPAVN